MRLTPGQCEEIENDGLCNTDRDCFATEKSFRKIMGYKDVWMLEVALNSKSLQHREGGMEYKQVTCHFPLRLGQFLKQRRTG